MSRHVQYLISWWAVVFDFQCCPILHCSSNFCLAALTWSFAKCSPLIMRPHHSLHHVCRGQRQLFDIGATWAKKKGMGRKLAKNQTRDRRHYWAGAALYLTSSKRGETIMRDILCDTRTIRWDIHQWRRSRCPRAWQAVTYLQKCIRYLACCCTQIGASCRWSSEPC